VKHWRLVSVLALIAVAIGIIAIIHPIIKDIDFDSLMTRSGNLGDFLLREPTVACMNNLPLVTLAWSSSANSETYLIQRAAGESKVFSGSIMSQLATTTYQDDRWTPDSGRMSYSYRVQSVRGPLRRSSNIVSILVPECKPVVAPTPLPKPKPTSPPIVKSMSVTIATTTSVGKAPSWMKWGVSVGWQDDKMSDFERLVGKKPQMEMVFAHWGNDTFPGWYKPRIADKGRTMVLFWEAVDYTRDYFAQPEYGYDAVISGSLDAYFKKFAEDAKAYQGEVILIPFSEFTGDWYPWGVSVGTNSPEKFITAWRHIHAFFVGVPNVKFAWVPNNDSVPDIPTNKFELSYPGDAYTDYVGLDGFNNGAPWQTFDEVFGSALARIKVYNKPTYIFSMGATADPRKADWITDALTIQLPKYPWVVGWLWFNETPGTNNWMIDSDRQSLQAFVSALP
jgi:hypothetical protein